MKRIVLHIDQLVLRGGDQAAGRALAASLQAELQRLLAQPGSMHTLVDAGDFQRMQVGTVRVVAGDNAALGKAVARRLIVGGKQ